MLLYAAVTFALPHLRAPVAIAVARFLDGFATLPCTLAAETALLARPIGRRAFWVSLHGVAVAFGLMLGPLLLRLLPERSFLEHLHKMGYEAAETWIEQNIDRIGWESTIDVTDTFV